MNCWRPLQQYSVSFHDDARCAVPMHVKLTTVRSVTGREQRTFFLIDKNSAHSHIIQKHKLVARIAVPWNISNRHMFPYGTSNSISACLICAESQSHLLVINLSRIIALRHAANNESAQMSLRNIIDGH